MSGSVIRSDGDSVSSSISDKATACHNPHIAHLLPNGDDMPSTSPGYSITVRAELPSANATSGLTAVIASAGGTLTAFDVVESHAGRLVADVTCDAIDV